MGDEPLLSLSPSHLVVEPGQEAVLRLKVRSRASLVDQLGIRVLGTAAPWATVEPPMLSLFPGAEGQAVVRFRPPRSWTTTAGTLPVGVQAISSVDAARSVTEECAMTISPFREVSAELRPHTSRGPRRGRHRIQLRSEGNAPVRVALTAQELDGDCRVDVRPPQVTLEPGQAARASVTVRPNHTRWLGGMEHHTFAAGATPEGGDLMRLDGAMRQTPLVPRLGAALLVVGVLAAAAVLLSGRAMSVAASLSRGSPSPVAANAGTPGPLAADTSPEAGASPMPGSPGTQSPSTSSDGSGPNTATTPITGAPPGASAANAASGGTAETQVYGWSYGDYRQKYDSLWPQGWRLSILQAYVLNSQVLYNAVWRQSGNLPEIQVYGWSYGDYRQKYDGLWPQGWRLYILQAYVLNGQVLYNAVWRQSGNLAEIQVYGWSYGDYRQKYDSLWPQGWRLYVLQAYVLNGQVLYNAVWRQSGSLAEIQVYGWSYGDYRQKYDGLWPQGWRLYVLQSYVLNGQVLYNAVWRQSGGLSEIQVYGWSYGDYRQKYDGLWAQGWRLYVLDAYVLNSQVRYNAVWRQATTR